LKVEILKQLSVFMPNRPGALSSLARLFTEKGINILGLASEIRDDSGVVRIAVAADVDASAVLSQGGFSSVETSLLSVDLEDKPGELYRIAKALADGKINITTVYGTSRSGGASRILLAVENVPKARALLEILSAPAAGKGPPSLEGSRSPLPEGAAGKGPPSLEGSRSPLPEGAAGKGPPSS